MTTNDAAAQRLLTAASTLAVYPVQFVEHNDHVTCLASAPGLGLLASGGLSSQAFLWDVHRGVQLGQVSRRLRCASRSLMRQVQNFGSPQLVLWRVEQGIRFAQEVCSTSLFAACTQTTAQALVLCAAL